MLNLLRHVMKMNALAGGMRKLSLQSLACLGMKSLMIFLINKFRNMRLETGNRLQKELTSITLNNACSVITKSKTQILERVLRGHGQLKKMKN